MPRQGGRDEQRVPRQGIGDALRQAGKGRRVGRELQVVLELRGLGAGGLHAIDPVMGGQLGAQRGYFLLAQYLRDMQQHRKGSSPNARSPRSGAGSLAGFSGFRN
ncbi:hypothetical protein D3C78_1461960 [compost metagenome]